MKKTILLTLIITSISCTKRDFQKIEKDFEYTERTYNISLYSGGNKVFSDNFKGIINGEEGTDGFYYFKNDTLIEVSGDYVIKSIK